ncbi:DMT family transporter [Salinilacihabitans rarus]|uniref:DMT family transporter n=1 Tax=Salinilacihabitans rarus TaxID=2961596 RepID=UPI0020C84C79|nr:DMT family transporter [Salinilacihabitans rarus]
MVANRVRRARAGRRVAAARVRGQRHRGGILFVAVALVMGTGYVAIRIGTETVPPTVLAAVRFDASAAILLAYAFASGRWRPRTTADAVAILVLGELVLAGTVGLLFVGQQYTTPAVAAVVMGLGPVVTVPIAYLLVPGERLSRTDLVGVVLGFVGVAIVASPSPTAVAAGETVGIALVLCAAISSSLGAVLLGRLETTLPLTSLTGWGALVGGVTLHLVGVGTGGSIGTAEWTPAAIAATVYLATVVGIGGYAAFLVLLAAVGPTRTSLTSFASPLVAIVAGWLVLGEGVTAVTLAGFLVVVGGFVALNWSTLGRALAAADSRAARGLRRRRPFVSSRRTVRRTTDER